MIINTGERIPRGIRLYRYIFLRSLCSAALRCRPLKKSVAPKVSLIPGPGDAKKGYCRLRLEIPHIRSLRYASSSFDNCLQAFVRY